MNNRTFGILAGVIGSALGAWWYTRRQSTSTESLTAPRERGEVIFDNTPTAVSDVPGVL